MAVMIGHKIGNLFIEGAIVHIGLDIDVENGCDIFMLTPMHDGLTAASFYIHAKWGTQENDELKQLYAEVVQILATPTLEP